MPESLKKYHLEQYRYQEDEVFDTDIPTLLEAKLFGKLINPKPALKTEIGNATMQLIFNT